MLITDWRLGSHLTARWISRIRKRSPSFFTLFLSTTLERCSTIPPIRLVRVSAMLPLPLDALTKRSTSGLHKVHNHLPLPIITP